MIPINTTAQAAKVVEELTAPGDQPVDQAADWAWTADAYAAAERNAGCRSAIAALVAGNRKLAHDLVLTSFTRQLRIHGLGYVPLAGRPYEQMGPLR